MNKEKIDTSKLIEEINNTSIKSKKTSCSILGIFLVFFSILIILYVSNKTSSYLYVAINRSSGDNYTKHPTIVVTTNDAKKITLKSSNRLKELLSKYYSGNKEDNKIDGELIRS